MKNHLKRFLFGLSMLAVSIIGVTVVAKAVSMAVPALFSFAAGREMVVVVVLICAAAYFLGWLSDER